MIESRWSLLKPAVRAHWYAALCYHTRRVLAASTYTIKGLALRMQLSVRPAHHGVARADGRRHILVVDDLLPDPLFGAGYPRAFAIVRSLVAAGYAVEHYPMKAAPSDCDRMTDAFAGAVRFHEGRGAHGLRRLLWQDGSRFDVLFVSRPTPMAALRGARRRSMPGFAGVIYDAEAVLSPRELRRRALFGAPWTDRKYHIALSAELRLARDADAITAVGQGDADLIRSMLDVPVFVLPHSVAARTAVPGPAGRADILFVGRLTGPPSGSPNVDSVVWFVTEVMPWLDRLLGTGYRLHVVGRVDAPDVSALSSDRIVLHGVVEDIQPLYDRCRVFVAPTRYAAGIPLKVVEAMGEGIPCVVTPLLASQLGADLETLATGDGAEDFARHCARLYNDDATWSAAQTAGFAYVARIGSPKAFDQALLQAIASVDDRPAAD